MCFCWSAGVFDKCVVGIWGDWDLLNGIAAIDACGFLALLARLALSVQLALSASRHYFCIIFFVRRVKQTFDAKLRRKRNKAARCPKRDSLHDRRKRYQNGRARFVARLSPKASCGTSNPPALGISSQSSKQLQGMSEIFAGKRKSYP